MLRSRAARSAAVVAAVLALGLGACGGDDDAKAGDGTSTSSSVTASATKVPDDVCALVPADVIAGILGEAGVLAKPIPGGGCLYPSDDLGGLRPNLTVLLDDPLSGGIDGARTGTEQALGATASPITVGGASGFVASGSAGGFSSTQAAVALDGLIVSVGLNGNDAEAAAIATRILEVAIPAIRG